LNGRRSPGRGQRQRYSRPVLEQLTHASRMSAPPKQMFVVTGSGKATCSYAPPGSNTEMPPFQIVATQMRPAASARRCRCYTLVYSITFGGFVGMSSYVSLLLTMQYEMPKIEAGLVMALLAFAGAMVRPLGGLLADRLSGVRVLFVLLLAIALVNVTFAKAMPSLPVCIALLAALYVCFGLGNGATLQLVPQRWMGAPG
jgi:nitrate/nitrite transporter NarK